VRLAIRIRQLIGELGKKLEEKNKFKNEGLYLVGCGGTLKLT